MNKNTSSFQLKGNLFTLTIMQLHHTNLEQISTELARTVSKSPTFFQHAPLVIDIGDHEEIALAKLVDIVRNAGLIPVGIRTKHDHLKQTALSMHLAVFANKAAAEDMTKSDGKKSDEKQHKKDTEETPTQANSLVVTQQVRSGQQIYARNADLIILNAVSPGAEILADGHIHVYGPLRGRVLAGISGDIHARIFCQSLEAELISIAGRYLVSENLKPLPSNQYTQVYLEEGQLKITAL